MLPPMLSRGKQRAKLITPTRFEKTLTDQPATPSLEACCNGAVGTEATSSTSHSPGTSANRNALYGQPYGYLATEADPYSNEEGDEPIVRYKDNANVTPHRNPEDEPVTAIIGQGEATSTTEISTSAAPTRDSNGKGHQQQGAHRGEGKAFPLQAFPDPAAIAPLGDTQGRPRLVVHYAVAYNPAAGKGTAEAAASYVSLYGYPCANFRREARGGIYLYRW